MWFGKCGTLDTFDLHDQEVVALATVGQKEGIEGWLVEGGGRKELAKSQTKAEGGPELLNPQRGGACGSQDGQALLKMSLR